MQAKLSTREEYRRKINVAVEYINTHLDQEIRLDTLADISCLSPYHFHRILKAFLGEPIGAFIVRKRVETAARLLLYSDMSIGEIAVRVGYEEHSSFSKTFKHYYGISPNEYRNNQKFVTMQPQNYCNNLTLEESIVERDKTKLISYRLQGDYRTGDYAKAWNEIMAFAAKNNLFGPATEYLTIYRDDPCVTEAALQRADVSMVINRDVQPTGNLTLDELAGGRYLVYLYKGPYTRLGEVYDTIYGKYVPDGGYRLDSRPMFEQYLNNPETTTPEELLTRIFVPIE